MDWKRHSEECRFIGTTKNLLLLNICGNTSSKWTFDTVPKEIAFLEIREARLYSESSKKE